MSDLPKCPLCGNLMRLAGHAMDGTPTTVECDTQSCPLDGTQLDIDAARRLAAVDLREENERLRAALEAERAASLDYVEDRARADREKARADALAAENERLRWQRDEAQAAGVEELKRATAAIWERDRLLAALRKIACGGHYGDMRAIAAAAIAEGEKP